MKRNQFGIKEPEREAINVGGVDAELWERFSYIAKSVRNGTVGQYLEDALRHLLKVRKLPLARGLKLKPLTAEEANALLWEVDRKPINVGKVDIVLWKTFLSERREGATVALWMEEALREKLEQDGYPLR